MPINYQTYEETLKRSESDISANLPGVDPTVFGSFVHALAVSGASRSYDIVETLKQLELMLFPQTAIDEYLDRWASYEDITRNAATTAGGGTESNIVLTGTVGKNITTSDTLTSTAGNIYDIKANVTLSAQSISITSLTRSGTTVTATTASEHHLASNMEGIISGASPSDYNGTFTITVLTATTFTYEVTTTPSTPATGTILFSFNGAFAIVESQDTEPSDGSTTQNLLSGAALTLTTPIIGVDTTAYVQFIGVVGATVLETNERLLVRILQSRSNPVANFNEAAIEKVTRAVPGVTRVKVKRITPGVGDVTILFVRDDDANIIPDASEIADVRAAILAILQASSDTADVYTPAVTAVTTNYTFSAISPDTDTMRTAIENNLSAFYEDKVTFEVNVTEDGYRSAIIDTVDIETGDQLQSFTLSSPSSDISVTTDEIGVLGTVTF